jgi:hypothetical protein
MANEQTYDTVTFKSVQPWVVATTLILAPIFTGGMIWAGVQNRVQNVERITVELKEGQDIGEVKRESIEKSVANIEKTTSLIQRDIEYIKESLKK